jgi:hypothetical protein
VGGVGGQQQTNGNNTNNQPSTNGAIQMTSKQWVEWQKRDNEV